MFSRYYLNVQLTTREFLPCFYAGFWIREAKSLLSEEQYDWIWVRLQLIAIDGFLRCYIYSVSSIEGFGDASEYYVDKAFHDPDSLSLFFVV